MPDINLSLSLREQGSFRMATSQIAVGLRKL